ncbi:MAG: M56 family metallopeptidase [Butyribacter sp.]|nr:M56 family metallopeptidase [bacterium]MDY3854398.1 M56 family metallopeptidase [Butyribacter sp.]
MEWLYRIFYTVLSLGIMAVLILPVVLLVRFLMRNFEKKYMVWEWYFVYLRSICPIALSSPLCMIPVFNRKYHMLLSQMGLSLTEDAGIMSSWTAVYKGEITATATFKCCSIIWLAGVVLVLCYNMLSQHQLKKILRQAKPLGENIYESSWVSSPVLTGVIHHRLYLPENTSSKEATWLLKHMEHHKKEVFGRWILCFIQAVHWFNPVMWLYYYFWNMDAEMAKDERTVYHQKENVLREYTQALLNFDGPSEKRVSFSILSVYERNTKQRAYRMMYQKWDTSNRKLAGILAVTVLVIWLFLLVPMQIAWSGETWGSPADTEETLFDKNDNDVIAKTDTVSPEGLGRIIQLEKTSGTKEKQGYRGDFRVVMYDSLGNMLVSKKMQDIFPESDNKEYYFSKGLKLCTGDYNQDNVQELVLGQEEEMTQNEFQDMLQKTDKEIGSKAAENAKKISDYRVFSYALLAIEDDDLQVVRDNIYAVSGDEGQKESISFEVPENTKGLFCVPFAETEVYYVWNEKSRTYEQKTLTKGEIEEYQLEDSENNEEGETQNHTLEDSEGTTQVLVSTKKDSTGSEVVQSVTLSPRKRAKKYDEIRGYYCDLFWVFTEDEEKERYAMMIYNGEKAQTFVIYDTQTKSVYYQHEDGTELLQALFRQYQEEEITFRENSAVLYNVTEKKGDVLTISFAASADDGMTVKGSYDYNVKEKVSGNLTYSRTAGDEN